MTTLALMAFNLIVNAAIALLLAAGIACGACALFGIERGRLRALVLSAPLFKAGYELLRGIPQESFFWAKLAGATQELGSFRFGFGVTRPLVPLIDLSLGALSRGREYDQSAADVLASALSRRVSAWSPAVLGALLALMLAVAVLRHAWRVWCGARMRAEISRSARLLETRSLGLRSVRILVSERWQGVPFAAGMVRPWVCLSQETLLTLSADEREAVIAHELAHLRHHDLLQLSLTALIGEALGFVPLARWLMRKNRAECEIAADQRATQVVSRVALASALVRVAELVARHPSAAAPELAFLRPGRGLSERVGILLAPAAPLPSRARLRAFARWGLSALVIAGVLRALLLGNH